MVDSLIIDNIIYELFLREIDASIMGRMGKIDAFSEKWEKVGVSTMEKNEEKLMF